MRITTKGHNALKAMINLAINGEHGPVSMKRIAHEESLSEDFLLQIFYRMKETGIITSVRGPHGGYRLGRSPELINLRMIIESAGECLSMAPCTESANIVCRGADFCTAHSTRSTYCPAHGALEKISDAVLSAMEEITLEAILTDPKYGVVKP